MATPHAIKDFTPSVAALMDPRIMKQQMANGDTAPISHEPSRSFARAASEQPLSAGFWEAQSAYHFDFDFALSSKDDAYAFYEAKAKKVSSQPARQVPTSLGNARQLLDPKGFSNANGYSNGSRISSSSTPESQSLPNEYPNSDRSQPRKREDSVPNGIGSFIEQLHSVSQREERPSKKQKVDKSADFDDDESKAAFIGGKGGELGEYMKQKKQEGLEEAGPQSTVIDLTRGMLPRSPVLVPC